MSRNKKPIEQQPQTSTVVPVLIMLLFIGAVAYMIGREHGEKSGVRKFKESRQYLSLYEDQTADRYTDQIEITENEISSLNGKLIHLQKRLQELKN
jgi:ATP-dependent Zn protease